MYAHVGFAYLRKEVYLMDLQMVRHLADLGKLEFSDEQLEKTAGEMTDIIALMDGVKEFDIEYDALKDNHNVFLDGLREDCVHESMPTKKVLQNAENRDDSFVVPKVVE